MPALLTLGGLGVALHYENPLQLLHGVPWIMSYGLPVSGKSLSIGIAISIIRENKTIEVDCYAINNTNLSLNVHCI